MNARNDRKREYRDLGIKVIDTQRLISINRTCPPLLAQDNLAPVGSPSDEQLSVLVGPDAFSTISGHAASDLSNEVGGFLVGRPYHWEGRLYVEIADALPGEITSSSAAHLTISPDTWAQAQAQVRKRFDGMHIVGWYHTHPRTYVFMSHQDLAIHEGFFREPWHVSLVVEPSRREAGFFVWDDEQVQAADGYHVAYPIDTPEEQYWQPPRPIDTTIDVYPITLDEFYEVGHWRTRWQETDDIAVKVRQEAMSMLEEQPPPAVGLCLGRVHFDESGSGPRYFVEVTDVRCISDKRSVKSLSLRSLVDALHEVTDSVRESTRMRMVGAYFVGGRSKLSLRSISAQLYKVAFRDPWQILLVGNPEEGLTCLWRATGGEFVNRRLVEMVSLAEVSGKGLEKTLAAIRDACQAAQLPSTADNDGQEGD